MKFTVETSPSMKSYGIFLPRLRRPRLGSRGLHPEAGRIRGVARGYYFIMMMIVIIIIIIIIKFVVVVAAAAVVVVVAAAVVVVIQ